jgi:hypothetical protein
MIAATMWTEVARYCQWPGDQIGVRQVAETDGRLEAIDTSRHGPPFSSATMPVTTGSWLVAPAQAVPAPWRDLQVNGEAGGRVHPGCSLWRQLGFDIEHRRGPFNPKMHPPMAPGKHFLQCELAHTVSAELRVM